MPFLAGDILFRAVMQSSTLLPEDAYVNDFVFRLGAGSSAPSNTQIDDIFNVIDGFYNDTQAGGDKVASYLGEAINRSATHELQAYSLLSGGSPIRTADWLGPDSPAAANTNLPTEVAGVLSYHADLSGSLEESGATRPRARRRGRLYIGPLTSQATTPTDDNPLLSAGFTQVLRQAAVAMSDAAVTAGWTWRVASRADATTREVVAGWTDNAPDTLRKRGRSASLRVVWTA